MVGASSYSPDVNQIVASQPEIIVLDSIGLSNSITNLLSLLKTSIPATKVVMVDIDPDEAIFLWAIRSGVVGYVLKDASALELASASRCVAGGDAACPPSLTATLFRHADRQPATVTSIAWGAELRLSRREQQLMTLLREGLTNKEIAGRWNLSEQTVKNHVRNIMRKVGARDRVSAVRRCETERLRLEPTGT